MKKFTKKYFIIFFALLIISSSLITLYALDANEEDAEYTKKVPILMYHHLLKSDENPYKDNASVLSVEAFEEHMKLLHDHNFNTITLNELEKFLNGEIKLKKNSILITFDDGYKSNYTYAYPILKKYNFKASIFLITSLMEDKTTTFNPNALQYLSWSEMKEMEKVFEYASHTHDLHKLKDNKKSFVVVQPKEIVYDDLKKSKELLNTTSLAYPYGQYNRETFRILESLGIKMAFTTRSGTVKPGDNMLKLKRYPISPKIDIDKFKKIVGVK
ncbi:polysaccharide deacetylase family protein [Wukongibacter baidiensis]|uniref:polysaccharide deacetylase family protein n=1 Tax=Wukongibacter baidiensis TaxID=1723361 RepID=UPI003D7F8BE4